HAHAFRFGECVVELDVVRAGNAERERHAFVRQRLRDDATAREARQSHESRMFWATRSASAITVRYGLISSESGKSDESATNSQGSPCTRPQASVTESCASFPMPQPPIRCAADTEIRPGRKCDASISWSMRPASLRSMSGGSADGAWTRTAPAPK